MAIATLPESFEGIQETPVPEQNLPLCTTARETLQRVEMIPLCRKMVKRHMRRVKKAHPPTFFLFRWCHRILSVDDVKFFLAIVASIAAVVTGGLILAGILWAAGFSVVSDQSFANALFWFKWTVTLGFVVALISAAVLWLKNRLCGWRITHRGRWHRYAPEKIDEWLQFYGAPPAVEQLVAQITCVYPQARFGLYEFVQEESKLKGDPLLELVGPDGSYFIAAWDEGKDISAEMKA